MPKRSLDSYSSGSEEESSHKSQEMVRGEQPRRRGRALSKKPCLNKNALMARENRQKKKEYVQQIERRLHEFKTENSQLQTTIQKQAQEIRKLTQEVAYFKSVLNNSTVITTLLKSMNASLKSMHGGASSSSRTFENRNDKSGGGSSSLPVPTSTTQNFESNSNSTSSSNNQNGLKFEHSPGSSPSHHMDQDYSNGGYVVKASPASSTTTLSEYNVLDGENLQSPLMDQVMSTMDCINGDYMSDTDFSQFGMDLLEGLENPLQLDNKTAGDLFNDSFLNSLDDPAAADNIPFYEDRLISDTKGGAGVCLHVSSGRVSLEFCPTCHFSSIKGEAAV